MALATQEADANVIEVSEVLQRVNHNHSFLRSLVSGRLISISGLPNPESLRTCQIIDLIDDNSNIECPGMLHHNLIQGAWIDEHKYLMGTRRGEVSDLDAEEDFRNTFVFGPFTRKSFYEMFYASRYIYPALKLGTVPQKYLGEAIRRMNEADMLFDDYFRIGAEDFDVYGRKIYCLAEAKKKPF